MWIMGKSGFISAVVHETVPDTMRVRARRRDHLENWFPEVDIIDLGADCPDYRWHADVSHETFTDSLLIEVSEMDYTSHVKESISGGDSVMYRAMMDTWSAFLPLQGGVAGHSLDEMFWDDDE